jgi:hypothetical protein
MAPNPAEAAERTLGVGVEATGGVNGDVRDGIFLGARFTENVCVRVAGQGLAAGVSPKQNRWWRTVFEAREQGLVDAFGKAQRLRDRGQNLAVQREAGDGGGFLAFAWRVVMM